MIKLEIIYINANDNQMKLKTEHSCAVTYIFFCKCGRLEAQTSGRVPRICQKLQSKKMSESKSDQAFGGKEVWNWAALMRVLPKCFPMRCLGLANCSSKCCSPWRSFCEWRGCEDMIFNRIHLNLQFTSKNSFQTVPNLIFYQFLPQARIFFSKNITSVLN